MRADVSVTMHGLKVGLVVAPGRFHAGEVEVAAEHKLVAPTLVRSQALSALYRAARLGEISADEGIRPNATYEAAAPPD